MINGTTTAAAEALRVSQPAVSKTLQELEYGIGFKLFERIKGRLKPTAEGALFFKEVEQSFAGLVHLRASAARIRDFGSGEIRIASLSALSTNVLPKALRAFQKQHPKVSITFQTHSSLEVRNLVAAGQFDLGIAADEIDQTGIGIKPFANYKVMVALPEGHPLCAKEVLRPGDLDGWNFIALAPEDTTRQQAERLLEQADSKPKIVLETAYSTTICAMVQAGIGIGLVNPINAKLFLGHGLTLRPFEPRLEFRTLLIQPTNRKPAQIILDFIDGLYAVAH